MMASPIDTDATVVVRQNSPLMIGAVVLMALFAVFFAASAAVMGGEIVWITTMFAGLAVFFAFGVWTMGRKALDWDRVVVTLSPLGYHDLEVSPFTFPWQEVLDVKLVRVQRRSYLRLILTEAMAPRIERPGLVGQLQRLNRLSFQPTISTAISFLQIRPIQLVDIVQAYVAAHGTQKNRT